MVQSRNMSWSKSLHPLPSTSVELLPTSFFLKCLISLLVKFQWPDVFLKFAAAWQLLLQPHASDSGTEGTLPHRVHTQSSSPAPSKGLSKSFLLLGGPNTAGVM